MNKARKLLDKLRDEWSRVSVGQVVAFVPGIFLIALGVVACIAPTLAVYVFALFLIALGAAGIFATHKILIVKSKVEDALKDFQGRILIQSLDFDPVDEGDEFSEGKKIIYH